MTHKNNEMKQQTAETESTQETAEQNDVSCQHACQDQITALLEQLESAKDRYARLFADIENMKRREAEEQRLKIELAQKRIFLDILPIIDNFERAIQVEQSQQKDSQSGINLIYALFVKFLQQYGVTEIDTSVAFDPEIHEAISQVQDETKQPGAIVQVFEKGYYLNNKVLRHAKVAVVA